MSLAFSTLLRNARADQITAFRDAGAGASKFRIYDGVRPVTGGAVTTLLAELTFGDPSSPAAINGILTANAIADDTAADNTGAATWYREVDSNDVHVMDGDVGLSGSDLNLNDVNIVTGVNVSVTNNIIVEGNV